MRVLKRKEIIGLILIITIGISGSVYANKPTLNEWQICEHTQIMLDRALVQSTPEPTSTPSPTPTPTPLNQQIGDKAKEYLGVPYVWGGTTPTGFDCSGLVQYVYAQFNINTTRTTYTQVYEGEYVPKENLTVGDLVFFGDISSPHHVGIYIGNRQFIHAPQTGDVVKISNLSDRSDYCTGRRLV